MLQEKTRESRGDRRERANNCGFGRFQWTFGILR